MTEGIIEARRATTARYLVAKYVPDMRRLEPRNIGVLVLAPNGLMARFLGEKDQSGEVDGRSVPGFVKSIGAYRQWIAYWRRIAAKGVVEDLQSESINYRDERFVETLTGVGRGTYCLVDGGFLLDRIPDDEVPTLTDKLYRELVAPDGVEERPTLESQLRLVLRQTRLNHSKFFIPDYTVPLDGQDQESLPLTFSYAFKNGKLQRLYQRVSLHPSQRENSVFAAAYKFQRVVGKVVDRQQTAALVYMPEAQQEKAVQQSLSELRSVTRIINLADLKAAQREFAALPALAEHA